MNSVRDFPREEKSSRSDSRKKNKGRFGKIFSFLSKNKKSYTITDSKYKQNFSKLCPNEEMTSFIDVNKQLNIIADHEQEYGAEGVNKGTQTLQMESVDKFPHNPNDLIGGTASKTESGNKGLSIPANQTTRFESPPNNLNKKRDIYSFFDTGCVKQDYSIQDKSISTRNQNDSSKPSRKNNYDFKHLGNTQNTSQFNHVYNTEKRDRRTIRKDLKQKQYFDKFEKELKNIYINGISVNQNDPDDEEQHNTREEQLTNRNDVRTSGSPPQFEDGFQYIPPSNMNEHMPSTNPNSGTNLRTNNSARETSTFHPEINRGHNFETNMWKRSELSAPQQSTIQSEIRRGRELKTNLWKRKEPPAHRSLLQPEIDYRRETNINMWKKNESPTHQSLLEPEIKRRRETETNIRKRKESFTPYPEYQPEMTRTQEAETNIWKRKESPTPKLPNQPEMKRRRHIKTNIWKKKASPTPQVEAETVPSSFMRESTSRPNYENIEHRPQIRQYYPDPSSSPDISDELQNLPEADSCPPAWYCEKIDRNCKYENEISDARTEQESELFPATVKRQTINPESHQLSRNRSKSQRRQKKQATPTPLQKILPRQMTTEEKKKIAKLIGIILATAGVAALIMFLLKFRKEKCTTVCNEEILEPRSGNDWIRKEEDKVFGKDCGCIYEKHKQVKCSNPEFKAIVSATEKLHEDEKTVCALQNFRKFTKRAKDAKHNPNHHTTDCKSTDPKYFEEF